MELKCYNNKNEQITHLTQWDLNQRIFIKDLSISSEIEVHATNLYREKAFICESSYLGTTLSFEVPNILLQEPASLKIYIYVKEADTSAKTVYTIRIPVIPRAKPVSYEFENNAENITYEEFVRTYEEAQALKSQLQNVLNNVSSIKVEQEVDENGTKAVSGSAVASYVTERLSEVDFGDISINIDTDKVKEYIDCEIDKVKTTFFDEFPSEDIIQDLTNDSYFTVRQRGVSRDETGNDIELVTYFRTESWMSNALRYAKRDEDGNIIADKYIYIVPINQPVGELYMPYYNIKTGINNAEHNSKIMELLTGWNADGTYSGYTAEYGATFKFPAGNFYFSRPINLAHWADTENGGHYSLIGTVDTNFKNFQKVGATFLHFPNLKTGETALKVRQCRISDFVICGTPEQYKLELNRGEENLSDYEYPSPTLIEHATVKAHGIQLGGGMLIKNVGFTNFYYGCEVGNTNAFFDGITFHQCHYGLITGTDIKVNNISGAGVVVLLRLQNSLCSATGIRGDSIGQHLVEITGGYGHTLADLDADFCMDSIVAIGDGVNNCQVSDIVITGVHGRAGVNHYYRTPTPTNGVQEITANDVTVGHAGEYGVVSVKQNATLDGAYIITNQSIGSNPFDYTIGRPNTDAEPTFDIPYILLSADENTITKGVQFVTTRLPDEDLTPEWGQKRIACLSTRDDACSVKVQTLKGSIIYNKNGEIVNIIDDATDIYNRMDLSDYAKDSEIVKTVNGYRPIDGNVDVGTEDEILEIVDVLPTCSETSPRYVLEETGTIWAPEKKYIPEQRIPKYTNQLNNARNPFDTNKIYNDKGYKENVSLGTNWNLNVITETEMENSVCIGLIPIEPHADGTNPILRINKVNCDFKGAYFVYFFRKDLRGGEDLVLSFSNNMADLELIEAQGGTFTKDFNYIEGKYYLRDVTIKVTEELLGDSWVYDNLGYVSILYTNRDNDFNPDDIIITVDEPIEYTIIEAHDEWVWYDTGRQYLELDTMESEEQLYEEGDPSQQYVVNGYIYAAKTIHHDVQHIPKFTNQLLNARDPDDRTQIYNDGKGYKENEKIGVDWDLEDVNITACDNVICTGLIPITKDSTVRINQVPYDSWNNYIFYFFREDPALHTLNGGCSIKRHDLEILKGNGLEYTPSTDDNGYLILKDVEIKPCPYLLINDRDDPGDTGNWMYNDLGYMTVIFDNSNSNVNMDDIVITVNQEIEYDIIDAYDELVWYNTNKPYPKFDYMGAINSLKDSIQSLSNQGSSGSVSITPDTTVTEGSTNVVSGGAVYTHVKNLRTDVAGWCDWLDDKIEEVDDKISSIGGASTGGSSDVVNEDIPSYWVNTSEQGNLIHGANAIRQAMESAGRNKSAFLFYSDAHWDYGSQMSPKLLKYLYKNTAMTKTFFGGDIVNSESSDRTAMEYLYEWREMLKGLPNHHSVVGNHDDGNGENDRMFSEEYIYAYLLAAEETPNMVLGDGMYYYIDEPCEKTRYLFLDTAYMGVDTTQENFIKEALESTQSGWHIVVVAHIWYQPLYSWYEDTSADKPDEIPIEKVDANASKVIAILDAYNLNENSKGKVEFCIGGHAHIDYVNKTSSGIPIILVETDSKHERRVSHKCTYSAGTTSESSVNGIIADYDNKVITVVRVGRGSGRTVNLETGETHTHIYTSEITTAATCTTAGVRTYTCSCGDTYTETIPAIGHTYVDGVCSVCGAEDSDEPEQPTYTNVLDTVGYMEGYRLSGQTGNETTNEGTDITGFITCGSGVMVYMKNVVAPYTSENDHHHFIGCYDENKVYIGGYSITLCQELNHDTETGNITSFKTPVGSNTDNYNATAYIRIGAQDINENSIIAISTTESNDTTSYVNALLTAEAADSTDPYNGVGYKEDTRYSVSQGTEITDDTTTGYYLSGYIPYEYKTNQIVYFKNVNANKDDGNFNIYWFNNKGEWSANASATVLTDSFGAVWDETNGMLISFKNDVDCSYFRVQCSGFDETSIISVGSPIVDDATGDDTAYTNVLDTVGYTPGYRLNSSGGTSQKDNRCVTGYISCKSGDIIRLKNVTAPITNTDNCSQVAMYNETVEFITGTSYDMSLYTPITDDGTNITSFTVAETSAGTTQYIRICAEAIDETSIITVSDKIE